MVSKILNLPAESRLYGAEDQPSSTLVETWLLTLFSHLLSGKHMICSYPSLRKRYDSTIFALGSDQVQGDFMDTFAALHRRSSICPGSTVDPLKSAFINGRSIQDRVASMQEIDSTCLCNPCPIKQTYWIWGFRGVLDCVEPFWIGVSEEAARKTKSQYSGRVLDFSFLFSFHFMFLLFFL